MHYLKKFVLVYIDFSLLVMQQKCSKTKISLFSYFCLCGYIILASSVHSNVTYQLLSIYFNANLCWTLVLHYFKLKHASYLPVHKSTDILELKAN